MCKRVTFGIAVTTIVLLVITFHFDSTGIVRYAAKKVSKLARIKETKLDQIQLTLKNNRTYTVYLKESKAYEVLHDICLGQVLHVEEGEISKYYHILYSLSKEKDAPSLSNTGEEENKILEATLIHVPTIVANPMYFWVILPPMKNVFGDISPEIKDVLYLPETYAHAENSGHFLLDMMPYYYSFVKKSQEYLPTDLQHLGFVSYDPNSTVSGKKVKHDVVFLSPLFPLHELMMKINKVFLDGLGLTEIMFHQGNETTQCFTHGFTGKLYAKKETHHEILDYFKNYFHISSEKCKRDGKTIVMIQRNSSRKILNIDALIQVSKTSGYSNVMVIYLENLTVQEQMQIISCADVLLGVQGSGMVWYKYLPHGATYIEVGYEDWINHFFTDRASDRNDLQLYNMQCRGVPTVAAYERKAREWFNYEGNLTEEIKQKVLAKSHEQSKKCHTFTIWMISNCECEPKLLQDILLGKAEHAKPPFL